MAFQRETKCVTFADGCPIASSDDNVHIYSEDECSACWYNSDEIDEIRSQIKVTMSLVEANRTVDENFHSTRGLEKHASTSAEVKNARRAVLEEYESQVRTGLFDDREMSRIYTECCQPAKLRAYIQGLEDQRTAVGQSNPAVVLSQHKNGDAGAARQQVLPAKSHRRWIPEVMRRRTLKV